MRSASLKLPQSRFASKGAPATFSPVAGICDWLSSAQADAHPTAPATTIVATLSSRFILINVPPRISGVFTGQCRLSVISLRQDLLAAEAVDHFLDHLDAEAGTTRRIDPAVDMLERLGDEFMLHRIAKRLQLEELAGRPVGRNRQARRRDDRRRPGMRIGLPPGELTALR